jgi:hypothetical protein
MSWFRNDIVLLWCDLTFLHLLYCCYVVFVCLFVFCTYIKVFFTKAVYREFYNKCYGTPWYSKTKVIHTWPQGVGRGLPPPPCHHSPRFFFEDWHWIFDVKIILFTTLADLLCRFPLTTFSKKKFWKFSVKFFFPNFFGLSRFHIQFGACLRKFALQQPDWELQLVFTTNK